MTKTNSTDEPNDREAEIVAAAFTRLEERLYDGTATADEVIRLLWLGGR